MSKIRSDKTGDALKKASPVSSIKFNFLPLDKRRVKRELTLFFQIIGHIGTRQKARREGPGDVVQYLTAPATQADVLASGEVTGGVKAFYESSAVGLVGLHLRIDPDATEGAVGA